MPPLFLIVTNPPHREWRGLAQAARLLETSPLELKARAAHVVPEIWASQRSSGEAVRMRDDLDRSGLRVFLATHSALAAVPGPTTVKGFRFLEGGILWRTERGEVETPYEAKLLAVSREPKPVAAAGRPARTRRPAVAGVGAAAPVPVGGTLVGRVIFGEQPSGRAASRSSAKPEAPAVDLYLFRGGGPRRLTLVHGVTRFQALGPAVRPDFRGNVAHLLVTMSKRFRQLHEDRRLVNAECRERPVNGVALRALLGRISPELGQAGPFDLSSRLVFLSYCKR